MRRGGSCRDFSTCAASPVTDAPRPGGHFCRLQRRTNYNDASESPEARRLPGGGAFHRPMEGDTGVMTRTRHHRPVSLPPSLPQPAAADVSTVPTASLFQHHLGGATRSEKWVSLTQEVPPGLLVALVAR